MNSKNLYCSAMMVALTMLLLSAVVYFVLGTQAIVPQENDGRNNLSRLSADPLRTAPARRAQ